MHSEKAPAEKRDPGGKAQKLVSRTPIVFSHYGPKVSRTQTTKDELKINAKRFIVGEAACVLVTRSGNSHCRTCT
jgi:hypothetical protein